MADADRSHRPLSPFMIGQYYRPQWTSMTSIFTRITGNGLLVGTILVVWWFVAAAAGPEAYASVNGVITSWFGDVVMALSLLALWYHGLSGIKHLIWDSGRMLEVNTAERMGQAAVAGSVVLTVLTIILL